MAYTVTITEVVSNLAITTTSQPITVSYNSVSTYSNINLASYLTANPGAGTYSNVQVATYLPTYSGNIANIRLSSSGILTFPDGTTMITAASGSNYGNVNVAAYITTNGLTNYSNVNVASYLTTNPPAGTYSNVQVGAYLPSYTGTMIGNTIVTAAIVTANIGMKGYVDNSTSTANIGMKGYVDSRITVANAGVTSANLGMKGYVDSLTYSNVQVASYLVTNPQPGTYSNVQVSAYLPSYTGTMIGNTIVTAAIVTANTGMKGYVDNQITTIIGSAPGVLDTLGELANALGADANLSVTITSQIANVNANITTANLGMKGYVDNSVSTANIGVIGYIDRANTIQSQQISAANVGIIGYIDNKVSTANIGVIGYIDLANTIQSNQITAANLGIKGYIDNSTSTANIGMKGYVDNQTYSNVQVGAYLTTNPPTGTYSNVQVANYLPTYTGIVTASNVAIAGNLTARYLFGNASQLTGLSSGSGIANLSVDTTPTLGGNLNPNGFSITANIAHTIADGGDANLQRSKSVFRFENTDTRENLASAITIVGKGNNMRMGVLGNDPTLVGYGFQPGGNFIEGTNGATSDLYFFNYGNIYTNLGTTISASGIALDGGKQVTIGGQALTSYSNVQLATYLVANPPAGTYSNVQVGAYLTTNPPAGTYSNIQVATYLPTYTGNIANVRLGVSGRITFADGTTQTTAGGGSGIANVSVDTAPRLGGNLNVNNFSITGNVFNKGIRFDFGTSSTAFWEFSAAQSGQTFYCGDNEIGNVEFTANVNSGADVDYNILKLQNLSNGSLAETKMVLKASPETNGRELGFFKPSGTSGYSFAPVPSAVSGDGGIYNLGGNLKLYAADDSFNPAYITFQSFFANTASEPFKFNLANGDLSTLGNINLAADKGVYVNGVALSGGSSYSNVQVASYIAGNVTVGNIAGKTSGFTLGYLEMPQVTAGNVTLALTDSGKHFYSTSSAPFTVTIPVNSTVAFPIGTVVSIVNQGTANLSIAQGSATLYLGGNTTSASRTITSYGVATLMKVATDTWFVNGSGVV